MKITTLMVAVSSLWAAMPALAQDAPDVDCENAETQMEMNFCAEQDFDKADAALNKAYKRAMASQKKADADVEETMGANSVGAVAALKKAQRAWIDYRDGHCEGVGFQARGGTMEPMLMMGCKAELSTARAKELNELAQGMGN
ncbi:lysozyme inhibitor LprI family protein [Rhizobium sp. TRM95796]|uniref:lysozyme inhibitor LprI family protein n=1 Tax=Rhizobium sp. TRM95796 TaxID=2979862 RepID=UPI0021E72BCE|nr:lysozyme inhibitor LprI family protein [Rhizobium sp. TRM95796]MCV3765929.1 lysozyme inhibitor LprI family protein [Rhizobium sp. TRM95796]